ncbi:hypothetical protein AVEN_46187-1 [Araneus ventricosus]|uniref:Uncharacterized protein n=1 Tax=Araneus ventricosus TaxID=182803 RepID=A0A4Y2E7G3_ARAVE|nr:hypothetical protein AVEN_46187-1 [Araneus ventricosus]
MEWYRRCLYPPAPRYASVSMSWFLRAFLRSHVRSRKDQVRCAVEICSDLPDLRKIEFRTRFCWHCVEKTCMAIGRQPQRNSGSGLGLNSFTVLCNQVSSRQYFGPRFSVRNTLFSKEF